MENGGIKYFRFKAILQQQGWISPGYVGVNRKGLIHYLSDTPPEFNVALESVEGFVLPGFQNAHSHAFQYAMAGTAEKHLPGSTDDFWSWREAMYECALSLEADEVEALAAMLYTDMLRKGYTHVAEFHYLHHDRDGRPYNNLAEMGERLAAAADTAGIKITLIPIFYQNGGFGQDHQPRQKRFISKTVDDYFRLLEDSAQLVQHQTDARLGFGVHSLRTVSVKDVFKTFENGPKDLPFHLHAAEQLKEVEDCVNHLKQRPVEWLLDHLPLHDRFHLVHCTHMTKDETLRLSQTGANVILCPGTEGNLGDGIFKLSDFSRHYGNWSIGTDSHISLNPLEDLRWLDYTQRLITHKRNTFDDGATVLLNKTIPCGRKAMGYSMTNFFELNQSFDAVVYDAESPLFVQAHLDHLLPTIVYTADSSSILGTLVNGKWIVKNLRHQNERAIRKQFFKAIKSFQE